MVNKLLLKRIIHWSLLATTILYLITGLGITQYRVVEAISFGLINKASSFWVHTWLVWFFLPLLITHLYLTVILKRSAKK